ncbi:MAG: NAD-dependent epimerase/dehydratase family protein [Ilumatobacteraceae bacterium]|nr:NAD-dependent epimerase/dehydratase family protein [Ilumatobacteraceae bacterium]
MSEIASGRHVVTGAGPVGRAVVAELVGRGVRPVVVTRGGATVEGADAATADLADPSAARRVLGGAAVVYQCAQPAYHRWPQEFPGLQRSIVDAIRGSDAVLVAIENLYGYGPVRGPMTEATPLAATTRKGRVRAEMWQALAAVHEAGDLRVTAARASDFYGPGVADSMIGERFLRALLAGKPVELLGDPSKLHTITYVPDIARAMVTLGAEETAWGRPWHVPNAPTVSSEEIVRIAAAAAGVEPRVRRVARWQLRALGVFVKPIAETYEMVYEFEEDFVVDHSAYAERFGDHSTALAVGFEVTVEAFRRHG